VAALRAQDGRRAVVADRGEFPTDRYVLDALGVIGEDHVELLFDGPLSPGLLRPPGKEHYLYVIMPVRVAMS